LCPLLEEIGVTVPEPYGLGADRVDPLSEGFNRSVDPLPVTLEDVKRLRREFVLDLFTRHGVFREEISALRKGWHITAEIRVPPDRASPSDPLLFHWQGDMDVPRSWPKRHPGLDAATRAAGWDPDEIAAEKAMLKASWPQLFPEVSAEEREREWRMLWSIDLLSLYDRVMPRRYRLPERSDALKWVHFFAACAVYDPPPDALLAFAEIPYFGVDFVTGPRSTKDEGSIRKQIVGGVMVNAPIVSIHDPGEVSVPSSV
jgi:hypothetical protein